ncbi:Zinc finger protein [Actinidia chinensis var. chinensis]|uniref:Zinc finger protein n=1 Tax=Actinidia chinensis var. chinensis TaxID=1590841 RepID=A0A2R6R9B8_ACTCC|nr:Zinc finger protein [Actinidia chinensis var. chinensis]
MEKHKCKLCFKRFVNGRALGGHMRSHLMNYAPPKTEQEQPSGLGEEAESAQSSSSSSDEEEENDLEKGLMLCYGLRENPKKSVRLEDPEFNFAVDAGSVILQDRESETESSKNPTRRRSKRVRKLGIPQQFHDQKQQFLKKPKSGKTESCWVDPEPASSISDASPEEEVAYCLMMLSRDKWMREKEEEEEELDEDPETEEDEFSKLKPIKPRPRPKYKCETCFKVFKSYQALGGHRASHKKTQPNNHGNPTMASQSEPEIRNVSVSEEKIHECPVCFRVFSSGQALGGHKRSHVLNGSNPTTSFSHSKPQLKSGETLIDLNLPAPIDDDEISQIELSAVSDSEFVNPIKH